MCVLLTIGCSFASHFKPTTGLTRGCMNKILNFSWVQHFECMEFCYGTHWRESSPYLASVLGAVSQSEILVRNPAVVKFYRYFLLPVVW